MSSMFDDLKGRIAEGLSGVVDAGKTSLKVSALRSQVRKLERERQDRVTALGDRVYAMVQTTGINQQELATLCQPITSLDRQLADLQRQIAEIESSTRSDEAGSVHCTCGNILALDNRFCRGCGKNVEDIIRAALAHREAESSLRYCECGASLGSDAAFCARCGKRVTTKASLGAVIETEAAVQTRLTEPETPDLEGTSTEPTESLVPPTDTRPCPSCGQIVPASARFCRYCGKATSDHQ